MQAFSLAWRSPSWVSAWLRLQAPMVGWTATETGTAAAVGAASFVSGAFLVAEAGLLTASFIEANHGRVNYTCWVQ